MNDERELWGGTIDKGKFRAAVIQSPEDPYRGDLVVIEVDSGTVVLEEPTGIAFGAPFGPDVSDVNHWRERCIEAIDAYEAG